MATERTPLLTAVGRLVSGSTYQANEKDAEGRPLVIKNGPNAGQPRVEYFLGLAVPKGPEADAMVEAITAEARKSLPALFDASGACISPKFAFKFEDGDSQLPNSNGVKPCDRPGYAGNYVFKFSSGFAPKCYKDGGATVIDPETIKRGHFIRIYGSVGGNGSQQQPGVYLNHSMVEWIAFGDEITSGPDASSVFGGAAAAIPAGASATPPAPATTIEPAPDFLTPPPPPAEEPKYMANGVAYTAAQLMAAGYSAVQVQALPKA